MIKPIIICLLSLFVIAYIYVNFKFPFWSKQPVFHFYKPHYLFKLDQHILTNSTQLTSKKYIDFDNVSVINPSKSNDLLKYYFSLIRGHYLRDKLCSFNPTNNYFSNTLYGENSYVALYKKTNYFYPYNTEVISGLTSKQLILYRNKLSTEKRELYINYVDFLCTQYKYRKQYLTPKVIYTFVKYIMELQSKPTTIFMFKRESEKQSFVPFCVYNNYIFNVNKIENLSINSFPQYKIIKLNSESLKILHRCIEMIKEKIDNFIYMDISTIMHYIEHGILHVYIAVNNNKNETPLAVYIFKENCFKYKDMNVIELTNSILLDKSITPEQFQVFSLATIERICKDNKNIGYISIENICDNNIIIKKIKNKTIEIHKYQNNFYLYNYILLTISSKEVFFII